MKRRTKILVAVGVVILFAVVFVAFPGAARRRIPDSALAVLPQPFNNAAQAMIALTNSSTNILIVGTIEIEPKAFDRSAKRRKSTDGQPTFDLIMPRSVASTWLDLSAVPKGTPIRFKMPVEEQLTDASATKAAMGNWIAHPNLNTPFIKGQVYVGRDTVL